LERILIAPGVHLSCDPAEKFNRCRISIHFAFPAQRATATAHALLPLVLERGYADCPDMTLLTKKLAKLYGADLTVDARPMGCNHNLCVSVTGIKDRFALEGEPLTREYASIALGAAFHPAFVGGVFDPQAVEKLEAKLATLEKHQEMMKAANAAIRMKDPAKGDAKLAELGYTPEDIAKLRAPDFCGRIGYPAYELQNNNANIRRIRGRIAELKKRTENTPEGWEFDGGRVVVNTAENRLQIIFDGKPDADIRTELKGEGFRWAPSQGAWQRQLTDNAMRAARRLKCIAPQV